MCGQDDDDGCVGDVRSHRPGQRRVTSDDGPPNLADGRSRQSARPAADQASELPRMEDDGHKVRAEVRKTSSVDECGGVRRVG